MASETKPIRVRRGYVSAGGADAGPVVNTEKLELGIGLGEAARLIGIDVSYQVYASVDGAEGAGYLAISLDPEPGSPTYQDLRVDDDCIFVAYGNSAMYQDSAGKTAFSYCYGHEFIPYPDGLVIANDLSLIAWVEGPSNLAAAMTVALFYELYKPNTNDLAALLARRF